MTAKTIIKPFLVIYLERRSLLHAVCMKRTASPEIRALALKLGILPYKVGKPDLVLNLFYGPVRKARQGNPP